ncbi:MAG: hypothetical protein ACOCWV_03050 [Planctomycetota bacterium]
MPYDPTWNNANAAGTVEPGVHAIRLSDAAELASAVNRRRLLTYQHAQDFSSQIASGAFVRAGTFDSAEAPPFENLRAALDSDVLSPPAGQLGGTPPTPGEMVWLWAKADADEGKTIVAGPADAGEVSLFEKLNGGSDWTDATLTGGATPIRAVHLNELRQVTEWLRRGRWTLPVYFAAGIFSVMPDTPWLGEAIANNGSDELRSLGFALLSTDETPERGLTDVTVRADTRLELLADVACTVEVGRCLRELDFANDPPTWNEHAPSASASWDAPGASGSGDVESLGSVVLSANVPGSLSDSVLRSAVQAMIDGAPPNLLVARQDTGSETIAITGELVVEFELNTPPN